MEIRYSDTAQEHRKLWKKSGQVKAMKRISDLIADIEAHPKTGKGKPEQLKHELSGVWSREIDKKNRIAYEIYDDYVMILAMIGHYGDK